LDSLHTCRCGKYSEQHLRRRNSPLPSSYILLLGGAPPSPVKAESILCCSPLVAVEVVMDSKGCCLVAQRTGAVPDTAPTCSRAR
jgi:hypothetical protein